MTITRGWKVTTHDLRPPIQGGDPLPIPGVLPTTRLDTSIRRCGAGWNFCADPADALRISGLWPSGRPSRLWLVETDAEVVTVGDKSRAAKLTVTREANDTEWAAALTSLHLPILDYAPGIVREVEAWREALGRPEWSPANVSRNLSSALRARGLDWELRRYDAAWDAWAARAARAARDAWAARAARAARDAWAALTVHVAGTAGWVDLDPNLLTTGIRDAYRNGLAVAVPVGGGVLGWAMEEKP